MNDVGAVSFRMQFWKAREYGRVSPAGRRRTLTIKLFTVEHHAVGCGSVLVWSTVTVVELLDEAGACK